MATNQRFPSKLTGAKAHLFAICCAHYSHEAEVACNDTPEQHPIFSWLSPQQRVHLVKEVLIGLLCEDEPLPPDTVEHYAAYLGIVATITSEVEMETDLEAELAMGLQVGEIADGEDLLELGTRTSTSDRPRRLQKEIDERDRANALICRQAEKNQKKLEKKGIPEDLDPSSMLNQSPSEDIFVLAGKLSSLQVQLFSGPPVTDPELDRPLTEDELGFHYWRRLCDKAFQEEELMPFPLRYRSFDWRCADVGKFRSALWVMFVTMRPTRHMSSGENRLQTNRIDFTMYADRSKHSHIQAVEKVVEDVRAKYDPNWDCNTQAEDQRCIHAICSNDAYCYRAHSAFVNSLLLDYAEAGYDFNAMGNYQKRLESYQRVASSPSHADGLEVTFHQGGNYKDTPTPADFKHTTGIFKKCQALDCWTYDEDDLRLCSRCKVVSYCSKKCQLEDWAEHKRHCVVLKATRKDKVKLSEICDKGLL